VKLSEAIRQLQAALAELGDRDVYEGVCFGPCPPVVEFSLHRDLDHYETGVTLWLRHTPKAEPSTESSSAPSPDGEPTHA
jgi:hypothetical protein